MKYLVIGLVALAFVESAQAQFAEPNDQGVSFGHMHLVVADLELHKRLWPDLFDAELVEEEGYTAVRIADALIFFRHGDPTAPSVATAADHFGLRVRDLAKVLSEWQRLGYGVDSQTTDANGHVTAYVTMPGGVKLALVESPDQDAPTAMAYIQFAIPARGDSLAWYTELFGASVPAAGENDRAATVPGSELRFDESDSDRLPTDGAAIDHIGFEIQEWDAFIEMLREAGIQFEFGPTYIESLALWVAFFADPSGVLVEITHGLDHFN